MKRHWVIGCAVYLLAGWHTNGLLPPVAGQAARKPRAEPQLSSVFPMGATRGSRSSIEIRGQNLEEAQAVWVDCHSISAEIKAVEAIKSEEQGTAAKGPAIFRVALELSVASDSGIGMHSLRITSPLGISNPLPFIVYQEPVVIETDLPIETPAVARRVSTLPVVVSGKIGAIGEVDTYSFEAQAGEELFFEVLHAGRTDPQLSLYEPAGSWFDPHALRRLAFNDEPNTASKNLSPALAYRFNRKGRFLATVGGFLGRGGPDSSYQLRIVPTAQRGVVISAPKLAHDPLGRWQERSFARELRLDRPKTLESRTMEAGDGKAAAGNVPSSSTPGVTSDGEGKPEVHGAKPSADLAFIAYDEPGQEPSDAREIPTPALIDGKIDRPGDVDRFKFRVNDGARLAFEIETPAKPAPLCAPRLGVFDEAGQEILSNVFAFVQGSGEFIEKVHEPKVTFKFERGGEYLLELRDLTSRNGGPDCRYRVVVRPQIPHAGRIEMASSFGRTFDGTITEGPAVQQLNLVRGEAKKVIVLTEEEEGFDGQIALNFEGLPPGVEVVPATEVEPERARPLDVSKKDRYRPGQQVATILLIAAPDAPVTRLPYMAILKARPVVNGRAGPALPVQVLPVMVVTADEKAAGKADPIVSKTQ
jgi:hypothetical protein